MDMSEAMIARNGSAKTTVVSLKDASPSEKYAAWELRSYLNLITSASIPWREAADVPSVAATTCVIAIGAAAGALGVTAEGLSSDGFRIKTVGGAIGIAGGSRGVLYGVYELLERLGCRFFTATCEKVPSIPVLALPQIDITQEPAMEYRRHNYQPVEASPRFMAKARLNYGNLPKDVGGGYQYVWFVHSFEPCILDPKLWYDEHPDYFSLVKGKRVKEYAQLCTTNPEVRRIALEKVRAALKAHPECTIISVSQNDWDNHCECENCRAIDEREGSCAGSLIEFINWIAERIEPEFPGVIIDTLAYMYSRPAPKFIRPRPNVCVRLCSIEACFAHSFETCNDETRRVKRPDGTTGSFIGDLTDWGKVCQRMYIWDYVTSFAHYPAPHPNWRVLQPNMQAFARNGVKGMFEQACGAYGGGVDMNELRAYLLAKLMWNPDCDVETHKQEFTDFYYGKAGKYVRAYIDAICDKVERDNIHIGFNDNCDRAHLTEDMLKVYDAILNKAEAAVAGDPIRAMRVARIRLSIRWVRMKNNAMQHGAHNPDEINIFFEDWRAHGLNRIDEWVCPETTHRALLENIWRGTQYYERWTAESGGDFATANEIR
jgi:hypothetical protein